MPKPKNTGLGKGLDAIFLNNTVEEENQVTVLRLSEIEPNPDQPRREFDSESLAQLADSIATHGLIQPIVVRSANTDGYYQIIAGERRWRAAKMAGLTEVPVIVMELDDKKAAQIAIIENVQRENLNPMEEANAYRQLMDDYQMTQEDLSKQIGKSRSAIANMLRLLDLPEEVKQYLISDMLSTGHAKAILGLKNSEKLAEVAKIVVDKKLSVRDTEKLVRRRNNEQNQPEISREDENNEKTEIDYIQILSHKMTSRLGRRVNICRKGENGKIEIDFQGNGDLDELVTLLCGDHIFDED